MQSQRRTRPNRRRIPRESQPGETWEGLTGRLYSCPRCRRCTKSKDLATIDSCDHSYNGGPSSPSACTNPNPEGKVSNPSFPRSPARIKGVPVAVPDGASSYLNLPEYKQDPEAGARAHLLRFLFCMSCTTGSPVVEIVTCHARQRQRQHVFERALTSK